MYMCVHVVCVYVSARVCMRMCVCVCLCVGLLLLSDLPIGSVTMNTQGSCDGVGCHLV